MNLWDDCFEILSKLFTENDNCIQTLIRNTCSNITVIKRYRNELINSIITFQFHVWFQCQRTYPITAGSSSLSGSTCQIKSDVPGNWSLLMKLKPDGRWRTASYLFVSNESPFKFHCEVVLKQKNFLLIDPLHRKQPIAVDFKRQPLIWRYRAIVVFRSLASVQLHLQPAPSCAPVLISDALDHQFYSNLPVITV